MEIVTCQKCQTKNRVFNRTITQQCVRCNETLRSEITERML